MGGIPVWKRLFWYFCPSQSSVIVQSTRRHQTSESYPSPNISIVGHAILAFIWVGAILAYGTFISYQWLTNPDLSTVSQVPPGGYDTPMVTITASCTQRNGCGNMSITANYAKSPACASIPSFSVSSLSGDPSAPATLTATVPLCFTGYPIYSTNVAGPLDMPGVMVDFSRVNPGMDTSVVPNVPAPALLSQGIVTVSLSEPGSASRTVTMDSWQVRSLTMGRRITYKYGVRTDSIGIPLAVQYEGRRPTWRATLVVMHAPYVDLLATQQSNNLGTVVGAMSFITMWCGSCFWLNSIMPYFIIPVVAKLFASTPKRETPEAAKDLGEAVPSTSMAHISPSNGSSDDPADGEHLVTLMKQPAERGAAIA